MNFEIMSRNNAFFFSTCDVPKCIIISITDVGSSDSVFKTNDNIIDVLRLKFDDVDLNEPNCITKEDGKKIIKFVNKYINDIELIVVHCEAGVSRSAGVCAALMLMLNGDDWEVFNNGKYCPNMTCYRTVLTAYFGTYDEAAANEKITQNIARWRAVNELD